VVAQPLRRAEELETLWWCVAPLGLGGLWGKKSTPSVWLGGTGELVTVGKQEREQERQERGRQLRPAMRQRYVVSCRVACIKLKLRFKLIVKDMMNFRKGCFSVWYDS